MQRVIYLGTKKALHPDPSRGQQATTAPATAPNLTVQQQNTRPDSTGSARGRSGRRRGRDRRRGGCEAVVARAQLLLRAPAAAAAAAPDLPQAVERARDDWRPGADGKVRVSDFLAALEAAGLYPRVEEDHRQSPASVLKVSVASAGAGRGRLTLRCMPEGVRSSRRPAPPSHILFSVVVDDCETLRVRTGSFAAAIINQVRELMLTHAGRPHNVCRLVA